MTEPNSNPFCTRFTRPGALKFLFAETDSLDSVTARIRDNPLCQIVGPHGSGKTTLLEDLQGVLQETGQHIVRIIQTDGNRSINASRSEIDSWRESTLVIVDGFEQLSWFQRRKLIKRARRGKFRLLITTHRDMGLPLAYRTNVDRRLVCQVVTKLQNDAANMLIAEQDIDAAIKKNAPNLREILFELYDVWNAKKRASRRSAKRSDQ